MRFSGLSTPVTLGAVALLTAALIALHYLRARPQRVRVVSTLLWREVRASAQPRTLWHRLSQWRSLLLLLLIGVLLVISLDGRLARPSNAREVVLVVDASLSMTARHGAATRLDEARRAAREVMAGLSDTDRLTVIVAGERPEIVHRADEPVGAALRRLDAIAADAGPAKAERALRLADALLADAEKPELVWITDQELPAEQRRPNLRHIQIGAPADNAGITGVTFVPLETDPSSGSLEVRVAWWGEQEQTARVAVTGEQGESLLAETVRVGPNAPATVRTPTLSADGRTVRVAIEIDDAIQGDNSVTFTLPRRPPIVIAVGPDVPPLLRLLLEGIPARLIPAGEPGANVIVDVGESANVGLPRVRIITDGPVIDTSTPATLAADEGVVGLTGVGSGIAAEMLADGQVLVRAGDTPLVGWRTRTGERELWVGSSVVGAGATLPVRAEFAVLLARAVRELAGWTDGATVLPARSRPELAGADSTIVAVADAASSDTARPASSITTPAAPRSTMPLQQLLLVVALAALVVDQLLYARGKVV